MPESYKASMLPSICSDTILDILRLSNPCKVEWAHRIGPSIPDRKTLRPVIVCYLDYTDHKAVLQAYKTGKPGKT